MAIDDLLAQKLRGERAQAHDVGYILGVPTLRQHRDGDDVLQVLARCTPLADIVYDLPQQLFLLHPLKLLLSGLGQVCSLDDFLQPVLVVLVGRGGFADFRLLQHLGVDTQRPVRRMQLRPVRVALIEIVFDPRGRLGAVADRQHHRRGMVTCVAPLPLCFAPVGAEKRVGVLHQLRYPRSGFMHIDLGPARQWGERFPVRATAFAAETPAAREVLAESRTMKGSGAAGVATLGAAGVEVAQNVLAETQSAILPLVPYLDTLRWVFIAIALAGVAVTIYARLDDWKRGQR